MKLNARTTDSAKADPYANMLQYVQQAGGRAAGYLARYSAAVAASRAGRSGAYRALQLKRFAARRCVNLAHPDPAQALCQRSLRLGFAVHEIDCTQVLDLRLDPA